MQKNKVKGHGKLLVSVWNKIKRDAVRRKIKFNIRIEDAWAKIKEQKFKCALSGVRLKLKIHKNDKTANASLDRIDSNKGYFLNNIQWVDKVVNRIKGDCNQLVFLRFCKKITEFKLLKINKNKKPI